MRKLLVLIICSTLCFSAGAQKFGLQAGYSRVWNEANTHEDERLNGTFIGMILEIPGDGRFALMSDPTYSWEFNDKRYGYSEEYRSSAINIPANFQYNGTICPWLTIFAFAGAYAELYTVKKSKMTTYISYHDDTEKDIEIDYLREYMAESLIFGANAGVGFEIMKHARLTAKYSRSLTNLVNKDAPGNKTKGLRSASYNRLSVGVAYIF